MLLYTVQVDVISPTGYRYEFPCGEWLSQSEEDPRLYRYLLPLSRKIQAKIASQQAQKRM